MAVYERTYRPYAGPLTRQRSRFLVIPRYAYEEIFASKLFLAMFVLCFIYPLILAVIIYIPHNDNVLKLAQAQLGTNLWADMIDASFFYYWFMIPHSWFAFVIVFIQGPALVASDLRNNAMPLYLSRPFSRWEYIVGKLSVLTVLTSLVTWVPGLTLFLLQSYLMGWTWFSANLRLPVALLGSSALLIAVLSLISLALSAYVKWKQIARVGLFGVFIVSLGMSTMMVALLNSEWAKLLSVFDMLRIAWRSLFGLPIDDVPAWAAWATLSLMCSVALGLLVRKVRAYEIVR